jgi:hypothetical protein
LLPPANLPEPGAAARVHQPSEDDQQLQPHESSNASSSTTGSGLFCSLWSPDASLHDFPPLQPLQPTFSVDFDWTAWVSSLGHRLYAALHARGLPRLANVLRALCHFVWVRRRLWFGLLALYFGLRVLAALLRFFRLANLPGVRLLVEELRNFVRIAFISGTGQSLFG